MPPEFTEIQYGIDESPSWEKAIPLGIQHVLAMFLGNVAPPLIVAGALGLPSGQTELLVRMALLAAGLATIVQCYGLGVVGARMPIVMGTSFVFVDALIVMGESHGLSAIFGGLLVGCLIEIAIGWKLHRLRWLFPPAVTSIVVMLIGLTLIPVGMDYAAGGPSASTYGASHHLFLAGIVLLVTLGFNILGHGFWRVASVLIGIITGYIAAIPMGMIDWSIVQQASWIGWPRVWSFGMEFEPTVIVTMGLLFVVTAMETLGDIEGTASAVGRPASPSELRGGVLADAWMSGLASLINAFPVTSYSQNVGLINFSGVASRHIAGIGGGILVILGFIPKAAATVSVMPQSVLGGGAIVMFSMIFASGMKIWTNQVTTTRYHSVMLAVSIGLGLGVAWKPEMFQQLPSMVSMFLEQGLLVGGMAAVIFNVVIRLLETSS